VRDIYSHPGRPDQSFGGQVGIVPRRRSPWRSRRGSTSGDLARRRAGPRPMTCWPGRSVRCPAL